MDIIMKSFNMAEFFIVMAILIVYTTLYYITANGCQAKISGRFIFSYSDATLFPGLNSADLHFFYLKFR